MTNFQSKVIAAILILASIALFLGATSAVFAQSAGAGAVAGSQSQSGAQAGAAGIVIGGGGGTGAAGIGSGDSISAFSPVGVGVGGGASSNASPTIVVGSGNVYEASDLSDASPTMFIPNLTTSNGTCANSFSIGGSGPGLGLAFGKTYVSAPCNARFNANQLNALGQKELASEVMCGIKSVAEADARMSEAYGTIPKCISNIAPPEEVTEEPTASVIWFDDKEMDEVDELAMLAQQEVWTQGER